MALGEIAHSVRNSTKQLFPTFSKNPPRCLLFNTQLLGRFRHGLEARGADVKTPESRVQALALGMLDAHEESLGDPTCKPALQAILQARLERPNLRRGRRNRLAQRLALEQSL